MTNLNSEPATTPSTNLKDVQVKLDNLDYDCDLDSDVELGADPVKVESEVNNLLGCY